MSEGSPGEPTTQSSGRKVLRPTRRQRWAFTLFALPIAAVVAPVVYSRIHPSIAGVPFFVWYQFAAVVFGGLVTAIVYVLRGTESKLTRQKSTQPLQVMTPVQARARRISLPGRYMEGADS